MAAHASATGAGGGCAGGGAGAPQGDCYEAQEDTRGEGGADRRVSTAR